MARRVTISGAANIELNGTFTITLVSATTFTYTITESPPTPSTGTYTASIPSSPVALTSLTRTGTTTAQFTRPRGNATYSRTDRRSRSSAPTRWSTTAAQTLTKVNCDRRTPTRSHRGRALPSGGGNATDVGGLNPTTITSVAARRHRRHRAIHRDGDSHDLGEAQCLPRTRSAPTSRVERRPGRLRRHLHDHCQRDSGQRNKPARHVFVRHQHLASVAGNRKQHFG